MNDFPGNPYETEELRAQVESLQEINAKLTEELEYRDTILKQFMELSGVDEFFDRTWWRTVTVQPSLIESFVEANDAIRSTKNLRLVMKAIKDNEMLNAQWLKLLAMMRITE